MATHGGAGPPPGQESIRLRTQLAPANATENSQDYTVSEREVQKRNPGDEGIIEELQNILPEVEQQLYDDVESSFSNHTLQRSFYQNRLEDVVPSGERLQEREALFKTPTDISFEEQKKGGVYQECFPVWECINLPRGLEQGAEGGINCFPDKRLITKGGADTQEEHISRIVAACAHTVSLFQGQPLSHDVGSAESPCEVSRDISGVELPAESSAGKTLCGLLHTYQGCGTISKTTIPFGSADLSNVSTLSSCVHQSLHSSPDWSCRSHQPPQERVSCTKPTAYTSSNKPVAALPVEQEGYLDATDDARIMNIEDEFSGEDDDDSSSEGVQRDGAEVNIVRDDEDNAEDAMIVDLRAEHLQRMCMHCSRHAREVLVLPCNHYNLCWACVQCSQFWRSHFHSEGNVPFCLQCNQHIEAMVYRPLAYGHMRRVLRCRCGTMRRGG